MLKSFFTSISIIVKRSFILQILVDISDFFISFVNKNSIYNGQENYILQTT